jgi:hypothetical protein
MPCRHTAQIHAHHSRKLRVRDREIEGDREPHCTHSPPFNPLFTGSHVNSRLIIFIWGLFNQKKKQRAKKIPFGLGNDLGTIVNSLDYYSYRLIGKLTAFLQLQEFSLRNIPVEDTSLLSAAPS